MMCRYGRPHRIAARRAQSKRRYNLESCSALLNLVAGAESKNRPRPLPTLTLVNLSFLLGTPLGTPNWSTEAGRFSASNQRHRPPHSIIPLALSCTAIARLRLWVYVAWRPSLAGLLLQASSIPFDVLICAQSALDLISSSAHVETCCERSARGSSERFALRGTRVLSHVPR